MKANVKVQMKSIMAMAHSFVRMEGFTMSEALKVAWNNWKLRKIMSQQIVRFYFRKVDGSVREALGCLIPSMLPLTKGTGVSNPSIQTYYDTERGAYRSFRKANLLGFEQ